MSLVGKFRITAIIDSYGRHDSQVRESDNLGRTLLIKAVTAVSAMMLSVCKGEWCSTSHAYVGVGPFRRSATVNHAAGHGYLGRELVSIAL